MGGRPKIQQQVMAAPPPPIPPVSNTNKLIGEAERQQRLATSSRRGYRASILAGETRSGELYSSNAGLRSVLGGGG
jgi:hypothetical protein